MVIAGYIGSAANYLTHILEVLQNHAYTYCVELSPTHLTSQPRISNTLPDTIVNSNSSSPLFHKSYSESIITSFFFFLLRLYSTARHSM